MNNTSAKNEDARYWGYQVLWWLAYGAVGIAINIASGETVRSVVIVHILWIAASIGLTHLFRREIERRRADQSISSQWPFLVSGSVLIGLLQAGLVVGMTSTITPVSPDSWSLVSMAALTWGMCLGTGIWTMLYVRFTEKRRQEERELKLRVAASEAELRALEAQINPHFLFNCLNSIRALVAENPARAQDMITRLANIFRYNLHRELSHTVPLASEVEVVGDYLALESVRFEDRLRVRFAIAPGAEKTPVPSMLLQALVENALKHGIAPLPSGGDMLIRAERNKDATVIEVENSGQLNERDASEPGGVGLKNTRERLRILYGGRASLELRNRENGRVVATVLIPSNAPA
jgi:two-component system, LytTR family, sensor kinase